jgi:hypothetical protein
MTSRDAAPTAPAFFMPAQTVTMTASSIREQILNRIHTVTLPGITGVGSRIYRSRSQAYSRSEAPAISISPGNDDLEVRRIRSAPVWETRQRAGGAD